MIRLLQVTTIDLTLRAFLLPFARHFRSRGWIVDAMAHGATKCPECRNAFDQVFEAGWTRRATSIAHIVNAGCKVREVVKKGKYDIVHVHTPVASLITRFALRSLREGSGRPKVVYTAHGFHFHRHGHPLKNAAYRTVERLAGKWTDWLVVINQEDERAARRYRIVAPGRIRYIPGIGVDAQKYDPSMVPESAVQKVRSELKLENGSPLFLMVAEFNPGKRHRDTLEALARLKGSQVHLAFAGEGALLDHMRSLADRLGLDGRVHFLGFRQDIPALMRASAGTLLPSEREGLPRSALESLSMAVPTIGTRIRGLEELLSGGCGLLVPLGEIDQLAAAMQWILDHREEAQIMADRGRQRILSTFAVEHILSRHEALYSEVLSDRSCFRAAPSAIPSKRCAIEAGRPHEGRLPQG